MKSRLAQILPALDLAVPLHGPGPSLPRNPVRAQIGEPLSLYVGLDVTFEIVFVHFSHSFSSFVRAGTLGILTFSPDSPLQNSGNKDQQLWGCRESAQALEPQKP
jgi:hypothetical protein